MVRQQWYISNSKMVNCALPFDEFERAKFWKEYLETCRPELKPYIIHGALVDEKDKLVENYKKEQGQ